MVIHITNWRFYIYRGLTVLTDRSVNVMYDAYGRTATTEDSHATVRAHGGGSSGE